MHWQGPWANEVTISTHLAPGGCEKATTTQSRRPKPGTMSHFHTPFPAHEPPPTKALRVSELCFPGLRLQGGGVRPQRPHTGLGAPSWTAGAGWRVSTQDSVPLETTPSGLRLRRRLNSSLGPANNEQRGPGCWAVGRGALAPGTQPERPGSADLIPC